MTEKEFIEKMYHKHALDMDLFEMVFKNKVCFWDIKTDKHEVYPINTTACFFGDDGYEIIPDIEYAKAYASFRDIKIPNFNQVTFNDIKAGECFMMLGSKFEKIDNDNYVNVERIKIMSDKNTVVEKC